MAIIQIDQKNIAAEHICCAITDKKGEQCVSSKKEWMSARFSEGLVFKKLDERGKVFIEYIPAEYAWCPIIAPNFMHINCFWVSGKYKGQGYANELLNECLIDAKQKGMDGITVLSASKKMPFLSDPGYLRYKGFITSDTAKPNYELLYYPLKSKVALPKFRESAIKGEIAEKGMVLYYSNQCPHTDKYAPIIEEVAEKRGASVNLIKIETTEQAQNAPSPFTTYSFFYNGKFITNEIFSEKKFQKFLDSIMD